MQKYVFKTADHPTANDRQPSHGEQEYRLLFPLEDQTELELKIGESTYTYFTDIIRKHDKDYIRLFLFVEPNKTSMVLAESVEQAIEFCKIDIQDYVDNEDYGVIEIPYGVPHEIST